ncbi:hypothetical protein Y032_0054g2497 [Ancylostoma ceylanicum]|uniref:Uncharacterized protein n=1 Tax=Ancylostoma ceylanicum TaxID=53326 RepID=A0A016U5U4_9BILA|nr:hypothetical protein Y032_0054g2497 [Ancylostoma ceylanicum]
MQSPCVSAEERRAAVPPLVYGRLEFTPDQVVSGYIYPLFRLTFRGNYCLRRPTGMRREECPGSKKKEHGD